MYTVFEVSPPPYPQTPYLISVGSFGIKGSAFCHRSPLSGRGLRGAQSPTWATLFLPWSTLSDIDAAYRWGPLRMQCYGFVCRLFLAFRSQSGCVASSAES